jgi:hypothetical protein
MAYELPTAEDLTLFDLLMYDVAGEPDMNEAILTGPDELPAELAAELTRRTVARLDQQVGAANVARAGRIKFWLACRGAEPLLDAARLENPSLTGDALMAVVLDELRGRCR